MLEAGTYRVEFENDGAPGLFAGEAENYLLLQFAPGRRVEIGVDLYSAGDENQALLNVKYLALSEAPRRPALGVGVLEVGNGYSATTYLVGTKDLGGGFRMTAGGAACESDEAWLLGAELQIGKADYLLADWASWRAGFLSLGVYREMGNGLAINLAYAWPNDYAEQRFLLLNLSHTAAFR